MSVEILFGAVYVLAVTVSLWSLAQLRRFLADTPQIADEACLDRFKALARAQMYVALVAIVLLVAGMVTGIVVVVRQGFSGLAAAVLVNLLVMGLGMYLRRFEVAARSLNAGSEALAQEYRRVCASWVKRALPDF